MTYFTEISEYQTYAKNEANFHFSYNSNSGGGQSFLGGQFINEQGELSSPTVLDGFTGVFNVLLKGERGQDISILLNDERGRYEIKPRGEGSSSMKLGVGTEKISPSKLISSLFMLPATCTVKSPSNMDVSILTSNNYWLQSMWLKCNRPNLSTKEIHLIPIDFIFCGGSSKSEERPLRYFKLEAQKRVSDIIAISNDNLSDDLRQQIEVFANIYKGETSFDYNNCVNAIKRLMVLLAKDYPANYSGIEDPLPFLMSLIKPSEQLQKNKTISSNYPFQQIFYGAPGTGKSFKTNEIVEWYPETIRTTFHPDSDYSTFVGAYKPTNTTEEKYGLDSVGNTVAIGIEKDSSDTVIPIKEKKIEYKFVKQAFLKAYIKAWNLFKDSCVDGQEMSPQFLVIEEINRGNCAQIFGDLFQLLDRKNGFSEYPIEADEDIQKALLEEAPEDGLSFGEKGLQLTPEQIIYINTQFDKDGQPSQKVAEKISLGQVLVLPPNFYIWATMNTSDQSLFPIDSAFKRRWDWKYVRICEGKKKDGTPLDYRIKFTIPAKDAKPEELVDVKWWDFVKEINKQIENATKSEDKKLGFFFCKPDKKASDTDDCNTIISAETFVGKVVFYLWQDVFKDYGFKSDIFKNGDKKISFHDFYPEDMIADEKTNPEGIDLALVKKFIYKVIGKKEDKTPEATAEA